MNNVISYSGLATKLRAMQKELLRDKDFEELATIHNPIRKATFLQQFPAYREVLSETDEEELHRMGIENRLRLSLYRDFEKIYRFANAEQRTFLRSYVGHFEVSLLRECLQSVLSGRKNAARFALYEDFLKQYAKLDLVGLAACGDMAAFVDKLSGTVYETPLRLLLESGKASAADYETAVNLCYFETVWRVREKTLSREEAQTIGETFGVEIDLLNLAWIHRAKKCFEMKPEDLYRLLIPIRYRLRKEDLKRLVEAESLETFLQAERATRYGDRVMAYIGRGYDTGAAFSELMDRIYAGEARRAPYSIAPILNYFYRKEKEIARIIRIIEMTHYESDFSADPAKEATI